MKRIAYFLLIAVVLVGCKSSMRLTATKVLLPKQLFPAIWLPDFS